MAQIRFLDQVPVGVYENDSTDGGQSVNIYYSGSLVLPNVPFINFTGSLDVFTESLSGSNGVTVKVVGFPFFRICRNYRIINNIRFRRSYFISLW
jgi:hypothetical protein